MIEYLTSGGERTQPPVEKKGSVMLRQVVYLVTYVDRIPPMFVVMKLLVDISVYWYL